MDRNYYIYCNWGLKCSGIPINSDFWIAPIIILSVQVLGIQIKSKGLAVLCMTSPANRQPLLNGNNREVEMFIKTKDINAEDPAQFLELQQLSSSIFQSKVSMLRGGETAKELAILLRLLK